jgi:hypothetical protein
MLAQVVVVAAHAIYLSGLHRILYGSDMAIGANPTARQGWAAFQGMLPLTEAELKTIAQNVAPYMC